MTTSLQNDWFAWGDTFGDIVEDAALLPDHTKRIQISGTTKNLERLADLPELDALAASRLSQSQLDSLASLLLLKELDLYGFRGTSCDALSALPDLTKLQVQWASKLETVQPVGTLANLRHLLIGEMRRVSDFRPLAGLTGLHSLSITGPMSLSYAQPIRTLEPLTVLTDLRDLELSAIQITEGDLTPLARMPWLDSLWLPNKFTVGEFAYLAVHLTKTECPRFEPWVEGPEIDGTGTVMLTGKPARLINVDDPALERLKAQREEKFERACQAVRKGS